MGPINNSVSVFGFPCGVSELAPPQAQEAPDTQKMRGIDSDWDKFFYSVGGHFSVGDGTKKSALDGALIDSFQRVSKLMLDYLPETGITPMVIRANMVAKDIDRQEGLTSFLLREVVSKKIAPMALTAGVGYGTAKLLQSLVLDPLGLVKDAEVVGSGLDMVTKWVLKKTCGAVMPEDIHGHLVNDLSQSLISLVLNSSLFPGEAIKNFSVKLIEG